MASLRPFLLYLKALVPGPLLPARLHQLSSLGGHLLEMNFHVMLFKQQENVWMGFQSAKQAYELIAAHRGAEGNLQLRKSA